MSKFRVETDVAFDNENDAIAFCNLIEDIKDKVYTGRVPVPAVFSKTEVNEEGDPIVETPAILTDEIGAIFKCRYHECFHDDIPATRCGNYVYVDFSKVEKDEHLSKDGKVVTYKVVDITTEEKVKTEK